MDNKKKVLFKFDYKSTEIGFMNSLLQTFKEAITEDNLSVDKLEIIENEDEIIIHIKVEDAKGLYE